MLPEFQLINMNGRMYDPVIGRVLSPDNIIQDPSNAQNYNRYSYCINNPLKYSDPTGDLFYLDFGIGWSKDGGFSISIGAGIGFKNGLSAGISIGYEFGSKSANLGVNAGYAGSYVSAGYNTNAGWNVGTGYSYGVQYGVFSFSVFSAGGSWSQNGGFSINVGWANYNQHSGFSFNPSFNVSTTARWGREVYFDELDGFDFEQDALKEFPYSNDDALNDYIKQYINYNEYAINYISAFEKINIEQYGYEYFRNTEGYIIKTNSEGLGIPQYIGGITIRNYKIFNNTSTIILSQIRDKTRFAHTINHELTHAYHYSQGYRNKFSSYSEYRRFSESSAYYVGGNRSVPAIYQNGIYPLVIPPRLVPVPRCNFGF
jgi:RHS repeat-associated protein